MTTLQWAGLLLLAVIAGAVVPFQSAINANLGRGLGHPLWGNAGVVAGEHHRAAASDHRLACLPLPSLAFISARRRYGCGPAVHLACALSRWR